MTFEQIFQKAVNEKVKELKNEVIDDVIMMHYGLKPKKKEEQ